MIKSLSCVELNDEELIEINIDQSINDKDYTILFINEKEQKFQKILQDNNELIQGQKN